MMYTLKLISSPAEYERMKKQKQFHAMKCRKLEKQLVINNDAITKCRNVVCEPPFNTSRCKVQF